MAIPAPYYSELDPRLKAVLDQITTKAVNGTVVPLFVDYKNQRVGIGNSVPAVPLHVSGETRIDNRLIFQAGNIMLRLWYWRMGRPRRIKWMLPVT